MLYPIEDAGVECDMPRCTQCVGPVDENVPSRLPPSQPAEAQHNDDGKSIFVKCVSCKKHRQVNEKWFQGFVLADRQLTCSSIDTECVLKCSLCRQSVDVCCCTECGKLNTVCTCVQLPEKFNYMLVPQLKAELKQRNLRQSGKKSEVLARLLGRCGLCVWCNWVAL